MCYTYIAAIILILVTSLYQILGENIQNIDTYGIISVVKNISEKGSIMKVTVSNELELIGVSDPEIVTDHIRLTRDNSCTIISVNRDKMYKLDRAYWSMVVCPEEKGFGEEKIIELTDMETINATILVLKWLTNKINVSKYTTIDPEDILPALAFISRFDPKEISTHRDLLTSKLLDLAGETIMKIWNPDAISLVSLKIIEGNINHWSPREIKNGKWKFLFSFPRYRPVSAISPNQCETYCWFWIRAFEHSYIQVLPSLNMKLSRDFWKDTPKGIHKYMRSSMEYTYTLGKYPAKQIKTALETSGVTLNNMCIIAVRVLREENIDTITSCMKLFLDFMLGSKHLVSTSWIETTLTRCKEVVTGKYQDMESSLSAEEIELHNEAVLYSPHVWNSYILQHNMREKRLAALHILSYSFVEDDSWYSTYISIIKSIIRKPINAYKDINRRIA